jgi:hypothetical protein
MGGSKTKKELVGGFPRKKARTGERAEAPAEAARRTSSSSSAGAPGGASRRVGGHVTNLITFLSPGELVPEPGDEEDAAPAARGARRSSTSTGTLLTAGDKSRSGGESRASSSHGSESSESGSFMTEPMTSSRSKRSAAAGGKALQFEDEDEDEVASSLPQAKGRAGSGKAAAVRAAAALAAAAAAIGVRPAASRAGSTLPSASAARDNDDDEDEEGQSDGAKLQSAIIQVFQAQQQQHSARLKEVVARTASKLKSVVELAEEQVGGDVAEVCQGLKSLLAPARRCAVELTQLESERVLVRGSEEEAVADLNTEAEQLLVKVRAQIAELIKLDAEERALLSVQEQLDQTGHELLVALQALPAQCERRAPPALAAAADELGAVANVTQGSQ